MTLQEIIQLNRVNIVDKDDSGYLVEYGGEPYRIGNSNRTHFVSPTNYSASPTIGMALRTEQRLVPATGVFLERDAPEQYREVMIFHELREMEYSNAGMEDAHERALNDEVLYALKFLDDKTRQGYFDFSKKLRKTDDFLSTSGEVIGETLYNIITDCLPIRVGEKAELFDLSYYYADIENFGSVFAFEMVIDENLRKQYESDGELLQRVNRRLRGHPIYTHGPEEMLQRISRARKDFVVNERGINHVRSNIGLAFEFLE